MQQTLSALIYMSWDHFGPLALTTTQLRKKVFLPVLLKNAVWKKMHISGVNGFGEKKPKIAYLEHIC